jgi:hypothetical protein
MQQEGSSTSHATKQALSPSSNFPARSQLLTSANALPTARRQKYGRSYDVSLVQRTYLGKVRHQSSWPASLQRQAQLRMQQRSTASAALLLGGMTTYTSPARTSGECMQVDSKAIVWPVALLA